MEFSTFEMYKNISYPANLQALGQTKRLSIMYHQLLRIEPSTGVGASTLAKTLQCTVNIPKSRIAY